MVPRPSAAWRAALTCAAVSADGAVTSQPTGTEVSPRALTAFSVITLFGTEVPAGSLLTSWMTGFRMHIPAGQGSFARPGEELAVDQREAPGRRQPGARGEHVRPRVQRALG